jgi:hypothetical protein
MTAALKRRDTTPMSVEKPAAPYNNDDGLAEQSADRAKRDISSKKFEFLRAIMKDTAISSTAYRLACFLIWEYRNEKRDGECFPGIDRLAGDLAVNEKTVRRAIKEVDGRYFTIERVGKQQSNRYWPIFGDRTQMSGQAGSSDRTFEGPVSGHFRRSDRTQMSAESSLEPSLEPNRGRRQSSPSSALRSKEGKRSTMKRSSEGDARPPVASPDNRGSKRTGQMRPCWKGMDVHIPELGDCVVVDIFPEERRVRIKIARTGAMKEIGVKSDIRFVTSPDDFDEVAQEDADAPF